MSNRFTITRTYRGGPDTIVHTAPGELPPLEGIPEATEPAHYGHTARMPGRHQRVAPRSVWPVAVLLAAAVAFVLWVLVFPT